MKHLAASSLALLLGACGAGLPVGDAPTVNGVQSAAVLRCSFLPTSSTVKKIVSKDAIHSGREMADQICSAIKSKRGGTVAGVPIEGVTVL